MASGLSKIDLKRLAAEVSAEYGIRIDLDDPMVAAITLNKLVLEHAATELLSRIQTATQAFETAAERVQVRAGHALAQEVKECGSTMREHIFAALNEVRESAGGRQRKTDAYRWVALAITLAAVLLTTGIWLGRLLCAAGQGR
jgi:hypothetical protein